MKYKGWKKNIGTTALAAMIALNLAGTGLAMPTGGTVITGSLMYRNENNDFCYYETNDKIDSLTTNKYYYGYDTIIDWDRFDIAKGEKLGLGTQSVLVNIVKGSQASYLNGTLDIDGTGTVYIINPNGINVGDAATIEADRLVLSAMSISDEDAKELTNYVSKGNWTSGGNVKVDKNAQININYGMYLYGNSIEVADGVTFTNRWNYGVQPLKLVAANKYSYDNSQVTTLEKTAGNTVTFNGTMPKDMKYYLPYIQISVDADSADIGGIMNGYKVTMNVDNELNIKSGAEVNGTDMNLNGGTVTIDGTLEAHTSKLTIKSQGDLSIGGTIKRDSIYSDISTSISGKNVQLKEGSSIECTDVSITATGDNLTVAGNVNGINSAEINGKNIQIAGSGQVKGNKVSITGTGDNIEIGGTVSGGDIEIKAAGEDNGSKLTIDQRATITGTADGSTTGSVNLQGNKVSVDGQIQGENVAVYAVSSKDDEAGTVEKTADNTMVVGKNASIQSTSGNVVLNAGKFNKTLKQLQKQVSGNMELDGEVAAIDRTDSGDIIVSDVSFDSGKDMATELLEQEDKDAEGIRQDFQNLAQSINKADADKAKKDAMIAGIFAAVDELMQDGNEQKVKDIHMEVLRNYEGSKPDMEASDNALKGGNGRIHQPEMAEVPEAEISADSELMDVTFSEA